MGILEFLSGPFNTILNKLVPDANQRLELQSKALELAQAGEFKELDATMQQNAAQADIDKVEAASASNFRAGWRPFIGWVCGAAFTVNFLVAPLATWIAALCGAHVAFPPLDMATMMPVLMGMLGLATHRTIEKIKGIA